MQDQKVNIESATIRVREMIQRISPKTMGKQFYHSFKNLQKQKTSLMSQI